ncbi:UNVERIFIED_CONTAM: hypothetical protein HDU68_007650 [Siphonaria sp. JEL0065]|nr:hypothetical protein HDU68_007650 [Siphonaria sp. JEL0065]
MTPNDLTALYLGTSAVLVSLSIVDRTIKTTTTASSDPSITKTAAITEKNVKQQHTDSFLVGIYANNKRIQRALATCVIAAGLLQMFDVLIARPELFAQPWTMGQRRTAFLAYGSILLRLWSMGTLKNDFTFSVSAPSSKSLCTTGPYELLLHPGYAGIIGWAFFQSAWLFDEKSPYLEIVTRGMQTLVQHKTNPLAILLNLEAGSVFDVMWFLFTLVLVVTVALLPPGMYKRMNREEEELKNVFGEKFDEYRSKRWRLIPFLY